MYGIYNYETSNSSKEIGRILNCCVTSLSKQFWAHVMAMAYMFYW